MPRRLPARGPYAAALISLLLIIAIAIFGPFLAPYDPEAIVGPPVQGSSGAFPLGTDILGRDVLSRRALGRSHPPRRLRGGHRCRLCDRQGLGLFAGYNSSTSAPRHEARSIFCSSFPPILFLLLLVAGLGSRLWVIGIGIVLLHVPSVARIVYAAALDIGVRGYVEAAVARGESLRYVLAARCCRTSAARSRQTPDRA